MLKILNKFYMSTLLAFVVISSIKTSLAQNNYTTIKIPSHKHNEISYQMAWCKAHNGIMEYENFDKTRIDCLTSTHAVEFDFYNKWAEGIGQALYYGFMTGKNNGCINFRKSKNADGLF